jgi:uncharacterized protein (DUF885 family)
MPRTGFRGSYTQFLAFVRSDPRLFYSDPESLLNRYRRTIARVYAQLPLLFNTIPEDEIAVKPVQQAGAESQGAAYYEAGTPERSAALVVNTSRLNTRPLWEIETLTLHEAVPGHHLQVARARAIAGCRRSAVTAGTWPSAKAGRCMPKAWAPISDCCAIPSRSFGYLADELLRAARLVVDTGIHALGWSRQQAVDYLNAEHRQSARRQRGRGRPLHRPAGPGAGYKIGQLRIAALRTRAQAALGERFDLRAFHDAVLGTAPCR